MQISFIWWNTSLSSRSKSKTLAARRSVAINFLAHLSQEIPIDFLALGEVTSDDIQAVLAKEEFKDFGYVEGSEKRGRLQFDLGVLYRKEKFRHEGQQFLYKVLPSQNVKIALRLDFTVPNTKYPSHIFLSHCPSRKNHSVDIRNNLGVELREAVNKFNTTYSGLSNTILLGDFNDEPFSPSLSQYLFASRDRRLVKKNSSLLYNPFWRQLGERDPFSYDVPSLNYSGSYCYSKSNDTNWYTFDQMIFSSSFLGDGEWHLREEFSQILMIRDHDIKSFDHFPVWSVIERRE